MDATRVDGVEERDAVTPARAGCRVAKAGLGPAVGCRVRKACAGASVRVRAACRGALDEQDGQGTTEYAILVGVLVLMAIVAVVAFRDRLQELWTSITDGINSL